MKIEPTIQYKSTVGTFHETEVEAVRASQIDEIRKLVGSINSSGYGIAIASLIWNNYQKIKDIIES